MTTPFNAQRETINDIRDIRLLVAEGNLPCAVSQIWSLNDVYTNYKIQERLTSIDNDMKMMKKYWREGVEDEQRPAMYRKIAKDLDSLLCDMEMERMKCKVAFFKDCRRRIATSGEDFTLTEVKAKLEAFVSDFTMTELLPEQKREAKLKEIHAQHQRYLNLMFDYLLSIGDMTKNESEGWTDIFTSPTIDVADRKLLIAAMLINMLNVPQSTKMKCLIDTYENADDEDARQPALVGWALGLYDRQLSVDKDLEQRLKTIFNDPKCVAELTSLQLQIFIAMNAEKDSKTMSAEIDKVRLSNEYRRIADSQEGKNVDHSLDDVLNASENNAEMDEWMETIDKLSDMKRKGSDLFFNGFAQLKNAGFFTKPSNWFVNFYLDHPDIASSLDINKKLKIFVKAFTSLPMLPTDKYSFVLLSARITRQLPPDIWKNAFDEIPTDVKIPELEEEKKGLEIRDSFTKLLYRFYKLFGQREAFCNPMEKTKNFDTPQYLFIANDLCEGTLLTSNLMSLCKTMYKMGFSLEIFSVCQVWKGILKKNPTIDDGFDFLYFWGAYCHEMEKKNIFNEVFYNFDFIAAKMLELAHKLRPEVEAISKRLFDIYHSDFEYDGAINIAKDMNIEESTDEHVLSQYADILLFMEQYEEAEKICYKILYLYPDSAEAISVMPRILMKMGKYDQTVKLLTGWLDKGNEPEDIKIYEYLAASLLQIGDTTLAIENYARFSMFEYEEEKKKMGQIWNENNFNKKLFLKIRASIYNLLGLNILNPMEMALFVGCVSDRIEELTAAENVAN